MSPSPPLFPPFPPHGGGVGCLTGELAAVWNDKDPNTTNIVGSMKEGVIWGTIGGLAALAGVYVPTGWSMLLGCGVGGFAAGAATDWNGGAMVFGCGIGALFGAIPLFETAPSALLFIVAQFDAALGGIIIAELANLFKGMPTVRLPNVIRA